MLHVSELFLSRFQLALLPEDLSVIVNVSVCMFCFFCSLDPKRIYLCVSGQSTLNMSVQGFQDILQGPFASYLKISAKIGGDVAEHAKLVQQAFQ